MKLGFMGTPQFALPSLRALAACPAHELCLVVCQPDKPRGRSKELVAPPVKQVALELNLPVMQPERLKDSAELRAALEGLDAVIVVAYGKLIPADWLAIPRLGFINVHASLLPAYRGAAPINRAIIDGCDLSGVSIMQIDAGLDTGPVFTKHELAIARDDDAVSLGAKLAELGAGALLEALPAIASGQLKAQAQDDALSSYAAMLTKEEGLLDWRQPARRLHDQIRGLQPWPGAYSRLDGQTLKIIRADYVEQAHAWEPGTLLKEGGSLRIACADGFILPENLQLEGRKAMPAAAFACGLKAATCKLD
ncbi:MAG: Methionyl-tRNA formyltransferase [Deltaproteobacteria bacterium ADurb.Bin510]|nr:MAG: Methionyl-tRNA formyltransferase [Deltaproteobacteria bacterium ADurb.Bin510]